MGIVTDKFVFAHLPKTGGQFVRNVVERLDIPYRENSQYHSAPCVIYRAGLILPAMITIRHPITWYQSRWYHRMRHGWIPTHPVDWECASNDFNQFVLNVINYDNNGRFTSLVQSFLKKNNNDDVEYVLRNENLTIDLYNFLTKVGYNVDKEIYNKIGKINSSNGNGESSASVAVYRDDVLQRLIKHESWVIDNFYGGITNPNNLSSLFE